MKTKQDLLDYFKHHHISYRLYEHEQLFTVEQADKVACTIPGGHIKNLFLKDDKGQLWLLTADAHAQVDLKKVGAALNAKKLRFADANLLMQHLGIMPGSVTPFALINDEQQKVQLVLDKSILSFEIINAHPLENDATIGISIGDFKKFLTVLGYRPLILDLATYIRE